MKKQLRTILALIMCLSMCLSLLPAAAAEDEEITIVDPEEVAELPEEDPIAIIDPEAAAEQLPPSDGVNGIIASGECGDNLTWELDEEGVLTISGTGDMWDYSLSDVNDQIGWFGYKFDVNTVVMNPGITSIGSYAFCSFAMTDISIPNSVTRINNSAFRRCYYLTSNVTIPESVTTIGEYAFYDCR